MSVPPPYSLQLRESFSDSLRKARFPGLFPLPKNQNEHRSSRETWVSGRFSLLGESAVHFSPTEERREIELLANSSVWKCE
jgi:hypothetical protein